MAATLRHERPGQGESGTPRAINEEGSRLAATMVAVGAVGSVKIRLPAAAPVLLLPGEGLLDLLAAFLATVQRALDQAHDQDEGGEEDDEDEAGVGDDLVVRLTPPALAAVVCQRG